MQIKIANLEAHLSDIIFKREKKASKIYHGKIILRKNENK